MLIRKIFRYRVYPAEQQVARIERWQDALRFLWNLALEQRKLGYSRLKDERKFPTAFDQINELTELRAQVPWLADVPRNVCAQLLVELDKGWQLCFKKLFLEPHWKKKGRDRINLTESHPAQWWIKEDVFRFPKLGRMKIVVHRPLEGKRKTCTISRDGDQWFASIVCEIEKEDPPIRIQPTIGIDRGIINLLADSDGRIVANPNHWEQGHSRLAHSQRVAARKKKGSKNKDKANKHVAKIHRLIRRQREHVLHELSAAYSKSHGTVVLEKLNISGMIKNPKISLQIVGAAWGKFGRFLRYKLEWSGGRLVEVAAAYSSQTCSACGHIDSNSRKGDTFFCTKCHHTEHADTNAAKVIKSRVNRSGLPAEDPPLGVRRSRKLKVTLRVPRSHLQKVVYQKDG